MEISEIRVLMKYEFLRGATTRQAVANINSVFIIQVATNATAAHWLKKFRSSDFDLSNECLMPPDATKPKSVIITPFELSEFYFMCIGSSNVAQSFHRFLREVLLSSDFLCK
ncbi:hypothetical protein NPIL_621371 [Nephila pilipes]|uniref:Mos1 transposase HTH domain-containing protein n=1 Tax=Nephila pilipes TaxID=299642 RepID=A0A8X6TDQ2_NEPPI|nr:hypothetical protein NPIL_621371 [Nephila pilipes]